MPTTTICHVWFATKRRSWLLQGDIDTAARGFLCDVARENQIELIGCESAVDHVHLLLRLRDGQRLPKLMNLLKGASSYRLHQAFPELKLDSGSDHFWQRGYGVAAVEPGSLAVRRRYVETQKERLGRFEK